MPRACSRRAPPPCPLCGAHVTATFHRPFLRRLARTFRPPGVLSRLPRGRRGDVPRGRGERDVDGIRLDGWCRVWRVAAREARGVSRLRKPCVRLRLRRFGWYVRLIICISSTRLACGSSTAAGGVEISRAMPAGRGGGEKCRSAGGFCDSGAHRAAHRCRSAAPRRALQPAAPRERSRPYRTLRPYCVRVTSGFSGPLGSMRIRHQGYVRSKLQISLMYGI